jgi:hypothetical protein
MQFSEMIKDSEKSPEYVNKKEFKSTRIQDNKNKVLKNEDNSNVFSIAAKVSKGGNQFKDKNDSDDKDESKMKIKNSMNNVMDLENINIEFYDESYQSSNIFT